MKPLRFLSLVLLSGSVACCADEGNGSLGRNAAPPQGESEMPLKVQPAGAPLETELYYYDGAERRSAWASRELVAEFQPSESGRSALLAAVPDTEALATRQDFVRLWRLGRAADPDALARSLNATGLRFSPVLHDAAAPGSAMRALPGGVIVVFDPAWERSQVEAWCAQRELAIREPVAGTANAFLLDSPAGLEALQLANRLHESGELRSASPNWWRESATR